MALAEAGGGCGAAGRADEPVTDRLVRSVASGAGVQKRGSFLLVPLPRRGDRLAAVTGKPPHAEPSTDVRLSFRQPCPAQAVRERREIFGPADREPILEIGDAQRGIELAQMVHRSPRFVRSAGERVA